MGYLYNQAGEGNIRRTDIVLSIDPAIRNLVESTSGQSLLEPISIVEAKLNRAISEAKTSLSRDDLKIYLKLRQSPIALGDMYEHLREIEVKLHEAIKFILMNEYGDGDWRERNSWWRKGIPANIRAECDRAWEEDEEPGEEPFCYTNFIQLKEILSHRWNLFSRFLPKPLSSDKSRFLSELVRLNRIRNYVMHPVKGLNPSIEDFAFVREFGKAIRSGHWPAIP